MQDPLIARLLPTTIRQRFLDQRDLSFQDAYDKARAQELAYKNSETFQHSHNRRTAMVAHVASQKEDDACIFNVLKRLDSLNEVFFLFVLYFVLKKNFIFKFNYRPFSGGLYYAL